MSGVRTFSFKYIKSKGKLLAPAHEKPKDEIKHTRPPAGWEWNPLRSFPRNFPCFCGSGTKAKKCCLPHQGDCVKRDKAEFLKKNWGRIEAGALKVNTKEPEVIA